jgi:tRNA threonylcarbamoyladenosine biosynthesis protein TsaB
MTRILSIDASTEACSVALLNHGEKTQHYQVAPQQHAKLLLPMVDELLSDSGLALNQLDAIACHVGPGAFTGVRIAVSAVQGLAYGANLPAISLSSLICMALMGFAKTGKKNWLCAIDARMQEVYFSAVSVQSSDDICLSYKEAGEFKEVVVAPENLDAEAIQFQFEGESIGLVGSGWQAYEALFFEQKASNSAKLAEQTLKKSPFNRALLFEEVYPNALYSLDYAAKLFKQNQWLKPEELQPVYVRNPVFKRKQ